MSNLVVNGMKNIGGMQFHDIEGGFGEGKKAMLVKEIANIHKKEFKHINEAINKNKGRFKDNVDIIDLKGTEFAVDLVDSGIYTQNSMNASKNIYLLSERGYSKLLKILEDDFAWEQYDKLVDGYFNMKEQLKVGQPKSINADLKQKEIETKNNNSFARVVNSIDKALRNPNITKEAKKDLNNRLSQFLGGEVKEIKHLGRKTYSATEIGDKLGISKNKVGRLAEAHNLKVEEFGEFFKEVTKSGKEVPSFRYYDTIIPVLKGLLGGKQVKLDV